MKKFLTRPAIPIVLGIQSGIQSIFPKTDALQKVGKTQEKALESFNSRAKYGASDLTRTGDLLITS